jgi:uncharacterized membrane protein YhaH (DUF805 family)
MVVYGTGDNMERAYWCISLFCVQCGLAGYTVGAGKGPSAMVEQTMVLVALLYTYVVVIPQDVE